MRSLPLAHSRWISESFNLRRDVCGKCSLLVGCTGLARLANLWTAPMPAYAPHFVKSAAFGYLLSAMFGVGLILAVVWLAQRAMQSAHKAANLSSNRSATQRGED